MRPASPRFRSSLLSPLHPTTLLVAAGLLLSACGSDGCGCGLEPIPGGFAAAERIDNSLQLRLTEAGIEELESRAADIVELAVPEGLNFEIPMSSSPVEVAGFNLGDAIICSEGTCFAAAEIRSLAIDPQGADGLRVTLDIYLVSRDAEGMDAPIPVEILGSDCDLDLDTSGGSRDYVSIQLDMRFVEETRAPREGMTRLQVDDARIPGSGGIQDEDIELRNCSGFAGGVLEVAVDWFKDELISEVSGQVNDTLQETFDEQLCTAASAAEPCPMGTFDVEGVCRFMNTANADCVPIMLGTEGQGDLGASLADISPGTTAPAQFLLASSGAASTADNGLALSFFGGLLSSTPDFATQPGHSRCVPMTERPEMPLIPLATAFRQNTDVGLAEPPHIALGFAEEFLNDAAWNLFDAGILCIGAGANLSDQLSTGLLAVFFPDLRDIIFPAVEAPVGIVLRPQMAPTVEVGVGGREDPLLQVGIPALEIDFYVFAHERYVRFMTFRADAQIDLDLTAQDGQLVPTVRDFSANNGTVSNSDLLTEDEDQLAGMVSSLLDGVIGTAIGSLGAFDLPSFGNIALAIPEGGIQGIEEEGDEFLAIFAQLADAPMSAALVSELNPRIATVDVELDERALRLDTWDQADDPQLRVRMETDSADDVVYRWRLDEQAWSLWLSADELAAGQRAATLRFQAEHQLEIEARAAGVADAPVERVSETVLVDLDAPILEVLERVDDAGTPSVRLDAFDLVAHTIEIRIIRRTGPEVVEGEWETFEGRELVVAFAGADELTIQARDAAGNVTTVSDYETAPYLLRGRPVGDTGGGCSCSTASGGPQPPSAIFLGVLLWLGLAPLRRRRVNLAHARRLVTRALTVVGLVATVGCDGCSTTTSNPTDAGMDAPMTPFMDGGGTADPDQGILATHLDLAAAADGRMVVSGYAPGIPTDTDYGDLVVGVWNGESQSVAWDIVDGAPGAPYLADDTMPWRGGETDEGDDVGTYSAIATDGTEFVVLYHDASNDALKAAVGTPGGTWSTYVVDDEGQIAGLHTDLIHTPSGYVAVSTSLLPPASLPGRPTSRISVYTANDGPSDASAWSRADVVESSVPCRAAWCPEGSACSVEGECIMRTEDCSEDCGTGSLCLAGTCQDIVSSRFVEDYPPVYGLYLDVETTPSGLGLVFYDRPAGELVGVAFDGSSWGAPFVIDGASVGGSDAGFSASLVVDSAGVWHVAYVDGAAETLRYARVEGGTVMSRATVDDGYGTAANPNRDGKHLVGDDASIALGATGEIRIAYQDATAGALRFASNSGGSDWTVRTVDDRGFAGFFTRQITVGSVSHIAYWWRGRQDPERNGVYVVNP